MNVSFNPNGLINRSTQSSSRQFLNGPLELVEHNLQGPRSSQEDFYLNTQLHLQTAKQAQDMIGQQLRSGLNKYQNAVCGSTYTLAVVTPDKKLTIGHIGDSRIYLVTPKGAKQLTTDHNINVPEERSQLISQGVTIKGPYIINNQGEGLNLSRTIGDSHFSSLVGRQPEFKTINLDNLPNNSFLVIGTDGVFSTGKIETLSQVQSAEQLQSLLINEAINQRVYDNLTLSTLKLDFLKNQNNQKALLMAVADGHGGKDVSQGLIQDLRQSLK